MSLNEVLSVFNVAEYFLSKSVPNTTHSITHLKLQKLVYYAQGWHLTFRNGKPLFKEEICAWVKGPVCPVLYETYKIHHYYEIPPAAAPISIIQNEKAKEILDIVWENYGRYDGSFLEELTHQEIPWIQIRNRDFPEERTDSVIPIELIGYTFKQYTKI